MYIEVNVEKEEEISVLHLEVVRKWCHVGGIGKKRHYLRNEHQCYYLLQPRLGHFEDK